MTDLNFRKDKVGHAVFKSELFCASCHLCIDPARDRGCRFAINRFVLRTALLMCKRAGTGAGEVASQRAEGHFTAFSIGSIGVGLTQEQAAYALYSVHL